MALIQLKTVKEYLESPLYQIRYQRPFIKTVDDLLHLNVVSAGYYDLNPTYAPYSLENLRNNSISMRFRDNTSLSSVEAKNFCIYIEASEIVSTNFGLLSSDNSGWEDAKWFRNTTFKLQLAYLPTVGSDKFTPQFMNITVDGVIPTFEMSSRGNPDYWTKYRFFDPISNFRFANSTTRIYEYVIDCNLPVFINDKEKAMTYLITGEEEEIKTKDYYINGDIYKSSSILKNGTSVKHNLTTFKASYASGYINNDSFISDINLQWANDVSDIEIDIGSGLEPSDSIINNEWRSSTPQYNRSDGFYYYGNATSNTNIPIFDTKQKSDGYNRLMDKAQRQPLTEEEKEELNRLIDDSISNISNNDWENPESDIGDKETETEFANTTNASVLCRAFYFGVGGSLSIGNLLYSTDHDIIQEIKTGLEMYGENPISFISDYYHISFNPSLWVNGFDTNRIMFGSYLADLTTSIKQIDANNTIVNIASVPISALYNDFRDYYTNYYLYLPYVGTIKLDIEKYLGKQLTIKAFFNIYTGELKYYLCSNSVNIDMYSASVKESLPLISTNAYANATAKLSSVGQIPQTVGETVGEVASGHLPFNGAMAIGNIGLNLTKAPTKTLCGGFSGGSSVMDSLDIILFIETNQMQYTENMKTLYNIPDNRVDKISSCSGYTECDNIDLKCNCSESEYNNIIALLSGGFYV